ncbi:hypothetical protein PLICRDRAFT_327182 [Plicaturopsis crispa FD-325 SS-3]|nr:hypothetical protein PLICRDRAFT_327182 [Plicaturopsis crispa FD-325 SS-3]
MLRSLKPRLAQFRALRSTKKSLEPSPQLQVPDDFPTELVVQILWLAAASSRDACRTLCLVASWTRDLAWPFLVSTIVFQLDAPVREFHHLVMCDPRRAIPVRNIYIDTCEGPSTKRIGDILVHSPNATRLALPARFALGGLRGMQREQWQHLAAPQDFELTLVGDWGPVNIEMYTAMVEGAPPSIVFAMMTRLDLSAVGIRYSEHLSGLVRACPQLTHVKVWFPCPRSSIAHTGRSFYDILDDRSNCIEFIVLAMDRVETANADFLAWYLPVQKTNGRLCVAFASANPFKEWMLNADSGADVWHNAIRDTETLVRSAEISRSVHSHR